jgi:hypothetical protein
LSTFLKRLSPRQYQMLRTFSSLGLKEVMSISALSEYDKRTLKSLHYQGWAVFVDSPRKGHLGLKFTTDGLNALRDFENADITVHSKYRKFGSYFREMSPAFEGTFKVQENDAAKKSPVSISHARQRRRVA